MSSIKNYLIEQGKDKSNPFRFYVYAYVRSKDSETAKAGTPYYIGKGQGDRAWRKHNSCQIPADTNFVTIIAYDLTEIGSYALERKIIQFHGRIDYNNGVLRNKTEGGPDILGLSETALSNKKYKASNTYLNLCSTQELLKYKAEKKSLNVLKKKLKKLNAEIKKIRKSILFQQKIETMSSKN